MAAAFPWNRWAVSVLKTHCYQPDGEPPQSSNPLTNTLASDIRFIKYRLTVSGDSRERIELALRGAPLVWAALQHTKWSCAKVLSKHMNGVLLYERAITAAGKERAVRVDTPPQFRQIFKAIAAAL